jgi:hypothetical protein
MVEANERFIVHALIVFFGRASHALREKLGVEGRPTVGCVGSTRPEEDEEADDDDDGGAGGTAL